MERADLHGHLKARNHVVIVGALKQGFTLGEVLNALVEAFLTDLTCEMSHFSEQIHGYDSCAVFNAGCSQRS